ncbi:MAG: FAD:protein FMN transferase [Actinomycetota bacterium]
MGGHGSIVAVGCPPGTAERALDLAARCERLWSRFDRSSEISRLNAAEGAPVRVDPLTVRLIEAMRDGHALSRGHFDSTLLPLLIEAGYAASAVDPSRVTVLPRSARAPGDLAAVVIDGAIVRLPPGTTLDPGGIGKGLAADIIVAWLLDQGAAGALVELGGDVVVAGESPEGCGWRIGVEDPFGGTEAVCTVSLDSGAVATSSQRKRRWPTAGGEAHHLISAVSRTSFATPVQTVTVIGGAGWYAEALTKAGFGMPASRFLEWLPGVRAAGAVIDDAGAIFTSANWKDYL